MVSSIRYPAQCHHPKIYQVQDEDNSPLHMVNGIARVFQEHPYTLPNTMRIDLRHPTYS